MSKSKKKPKRLDVNVGASRREDLRSLKSAIVGMEMDTDETIKRLTSAVHVVNEMAGATECNVKAFRCALRDSRDAFEFVLKSKRLTPADRYAMMAALKTVKIVLLDRDPT